MDISTLWDNLAYFLHAVVPEAERSGVKLAIHPDDPPWPVFGIPRIVTCAASLRKIFAIEPSKANGLCLCTASLSADPGNDVNAMINEFGSRIFFAHMRNIKIIGEKSFVECAHWSKAGSLDMKAIVASLVTSGYDGYVRPDHGRMIWDERGKPGYGLFDRALGAQYLLGLIEALSDGNA
jgi:mannonate dehydratase